MGSVSCSLSVFFEDPFWVGLFEKTKNGKLTVSKVTFGAEPKDAEVYEFVLRNYKRLPFSPAVSVQRKETRPNPKKMQRSIRKSLAQIGIGTKSQQALKLQQEQKKLERKSESRDRKLAEADRQFRLKQQKKKEKHRGR